MKYYKVMVDLTIWHLRPFKNNHTVQNKNYIEYGFLCFRLVIG
jgi:hypothetical protein